MPFQNPLKGACLCRSLLFPSNCRQTEIRRRRGEVRTTVRKGFAGSVLVAGRLHVRGGSCWQSVGRWHLTEELAEIGSGNWSNSRIDSLAVRGSVKVDGPGGSGRDGPESQETSRDGGVGVMHALASR